MEAVHKLLVEASMRKDMWATPQTKIRRRKPVLGSMGQSERIKEFSSPASCNLECQGVRIEKELIEKDQMETEKEEVKKKARRREHTAPLIKQPEGKIDELA